VQVSIKQARGSAGSFQPLATLTLDEGATGRRWRHCLRPDEVQRPRGRPLPGLIDRPAPRCLPAQPRGARQERRARPRRLTAITARFVGRGNAPLA
jgi:hypothetical protein